MSEQWSESCRVCLERVATVVLDTSEGETRVCQKCSRFFEEFGRLYGLPVVRKRAALRSVG